MIVGYAIGNNFLCLKCSPAFKWAFFFFFFFFFYKVNIKFTKLVYCSLYKSVSCLFNYWMILFMHLHNNLTMLKHVYILKCSYFWWCIVIIIAVQYILPDFAALRARLAQSVDLADYSVVDSFYSHSFSINLFDCFR